MSRIYLDYNATSPYALSVLEYMASGDVTFANPSSAHTSGKSARKLVNQAKSFLLSKFNLDKSFNVIFHSGTTEFVNTLFRGLSNEFAIFYFPSDHPCVTELASSLRLDGREVFELDIDENGNFDLDSVVDKIKDYQVNSGNKVILNYTFVHNETGVYWPLDLAAKIKEQTGCLIHVDAVQSVGKIENFLELNSVIDFYSYSAHKFGALKGVGFSFVKKDVLFNPLIIGGGQQSGARAGTENVLGIHSIVLALNELIEKFDYKSSLSFKLDVEAKLNSILGNKGEIVGGNAKYGRNCNTICFVLYEKKSDVSLIQFDLNGIDVSSGSACSVQSLKDSKTLVAMGLKKYASNSIRVSFGPIDYQFSEKLNPFFNVVTSLVK